MNRNSIVTDYMNFCMICGKPLVEIHHGLSGTANRKIADEWKVLLPLCPYHHNSSKMSVHLNLEMQVLSKQLSQLAVEKEIYRRQLYNDDSDPAREQFRKLFGKSFL